MQCRILDDPPFVVLRQWCDGSQSITYEHGYCVGFKGNFAGMSFAWYFSTTINVVSQYSEINSLFISLEQRGNVSQGSRDSSNWKLQAPENQLEGFMYAEFDLSKEISKSDKSFTIWYFLCEFMSCYYSMLLFMSSLHYQMNTNLMTKIYELLFRVENKLSRSTR